MTGIDDAASTTRTSPGVALARIPPSPSVEPGELIERALAVAVGAASFVAAVVMAALVKSLGADPTAPQPHGDEPTLKRRPSVAGALLGLSAEATRWSVRASSPVTRRIGRLISFTEDLPPVRLASARFDDLLARFDASWEDERRRREEAASTFAASLITEIVGATLDHVDLNAIARERINVNAIVDRVDIEGVMERIDLDAVAQRIDVQDIAARVDVTALAERVDLDELVQRLELVRITQQIIDELDIGEIIRDSTGSMAMETAEGLRVQGMNADRFVSRLVDRALGRRDREDAHALGNGRPDERSP